MNSAIFLMEAFLASARPPGPEVAPDQRVAFHARLLAIGLILLGISPFTALFATCDLGSLENGHAADFMVKADTSPDESLALPAASAPSSPLFAAPVFGSFQIADRPSLNRRTPIVLRL